MCLCPVTLSGKCVQHLLTHSKINWQILDITDQCYCEGFIPTPGIFLIIFCPSSQYSTIRWWSHWLSKVGQPASQRGLVIRYICNNNSRMWGWGTSLGGGKSSNRGSKATYGQRSGSQRSFGCRWKFWNLLVKEDFKTVLQMPFSLRNDWETQEKHTLRSNECLWSQLENSIK